MSARARRSGALAPIDSEVRLVTEREIRFIVRVARIGDAKRRARRAAPPGFNPFSPPDPELVAADVAPAHRVLLNKYPVIDDHLLVVTREPEPQTAPLTPGDFEAWWSCLLEGAALGFYNAGPAAGASQAHRHLQLLRLPLCAEVSLPVAPLLAELPDDGRPARMRLPFRHAALRWRERLAAMDGAARAHAAYRVLLAEVGESPDAPGPYNLLATEDAMWLVPRTRDSLDGIEVNALGFAGALLVRDEPCFARLVERGPLELLAGVSHS